MKTRENIISKKVGFVMAWFYLVLCITYALYILI